MSAVGVVLAGPHGHGRWHLRNLRRLAADTGIRLVGVCTADPLDDELSTLAGPVPVSDSLDELVRRTEADVTIVCTPIHTHVDLALAAMNAGSHVLLEKPPASTLDDYERLVAGVRQAGLACQVGFQTLGSQALLAIRMLVAAGAIGDVLGIGGAGAWVRDASYYARSEWAGRRQVEGTPVVDGALTNPFAHAIASALRLAECEEPKELALIETELYRANPIESDDTSSLRLTTVQGKVITVAVSLCARSEKVPYLQVHGSRGSISLFYSRDEVRLESPDGVKVTRHPRVDLLENLARHLEEPATPLLVPPERTHAFVEIVEAVRRNPEPVAIGEPYARVEGTGLSERRVVDGIDEAVADSADQLLTFSELGLPWASGSPTTTTPRSWTGRLEAALRPGAAHPLDIMSRDLRP